MGKVTAAYLAWPQIAARMEKRARQKGLAEEEAQDCVEDLALRLFQRFPHLLIHPLTGQEQAWLRACLRNQIHLTLRAYLHRKRHEISQTGLTRKEEAWVNRMAANATTDPERCVERTQFWELVDRLSQRLAPIPRQVFCRHHLQEESIPEIASSLGRTANATHQILLRAHRQMSRLMERMGLGEAVVRNCTKEDRNGPSVCRPMPTQRMQTADE